MSDKATIPTAKTFFEEISNFDNPYGMIGALKEVGMYKHVLDIMKRYANSVTKLHLEALTDEIKENSEIHFPASNNLNPSVDKQSISETTKKYIETNLK